jgi:hypothetical protein
MAKVMTSSKRLDKKIKDISADCELMKEMIKSWEDYLVWDLANPWDGQSIRREPCHHIPDNWRNKMERPNADQRNIYRSMIAWHRSALNTNETWLKHALAYVAEVR